MAESFITVGMVGDRELVLKLRNAAPQAMQALVKKVTELALLLEGYVKEDKLHGQVLNRITGALSRSIQHRVEVASMAVWGFVYSSGDVKYAGIHEFGGTIPAHKIEASKADALHFVLGGRDVFVKSVQMPDVHMPERSYLRSSLREWAGRIETEMKQAYIAGLRNSLGDA